jgi:hypothetical protein
MIDPDVAARKEQAYSAYKDQLAGAWRNPPHVAVPAATILGIGPANKVLEPAGARTDPNAASRIERLRERTHGGR